MSEEIQKKRDNFKVLSDKEHIRLRPGMYIGSIDIQETKVLWDGEFKTSQLNEGILKICNEILDNSIDENSRTDGMFASRIDVKMDKTTFSVTDNGRGIPIELVMKPDGSKAYRPAVAWGEVKAGSNFDDSVRVSVGAMGVGSSLSNIFSKSFIGHTDDGKQALTFTASAGHTISVDLHKTKKRGTSVTLEPDFAYFNLQNFDDNHIKFIEERIKSLSIAFPLIRFTFNGNVLKIKKAEELYNTIYSVKISENVWYGFSKSNGTFDTSSIVNGLTIPNGGQHIDWFVNGAMSELSTIIKRKKKVDLPVSKLRSYVNCFSVIVGFPALKFDSQTKTKITNSVTEIKSYIGDVDFTKIANALFKNDDLISDILAYTKFQEDLEAKKALEKLDKPKKKLTSENLLDSVGVTKRLFLCEGLSAMGGLSPSFGRKGNAFYAMKGVPANVWEMTHQQMVANKEFSFIYQYIKNASDDLNVVIASDSDADGDHIRGLQIAFFQKYFPDLITAKRIKILKTPIAAEVGKDGLPSKWVYSFDEISTLNPKSSKYFKGLGSWTAKTLKPVIEHDGFDNMVVTIDVPNTVTLDSWFRTDKADERKLLIENANAFDIMKL